MNLKRELGIMISTAAIVSGLFMINSPDFEDNESNAKITKIDKNTEIRVVEGNKYRCTLLHEK
jgi:hypothetical protein